jgi:glutamate dehydrogenase
MAHNYFKDQKELINKIQTSNKSSKKNPLLNNFIEQFYSHVPVEETNNSALINLYNIAENVFKFIALRKSTEPQIRIYNPNVKENGWQSKYGVIELLNDDRPFLVDSITEELNRLGIKVHKIVHPIIAVERDSKGNLLSISSAHEKDKKYESVIHIQLKCQVDSKLVKKLVSRIEIVLKNVRAVTDDWLLMRSKTNELINQIKNSKFKEIKEFLIWIESGNFTFTGYAEYKVKKDKASLVSGSEFGILKLRDDELPEVIENNVINQNIRKKAKNFNIEIGKINIASLVHRNTNLDYILLPKYENNEISGAYIFIGLFTSKLFYQSINLIPIIRQKVFNIVERSGFKPISYSGKEIITILEALPRDELFQMSEEELFNTVMDIYALKIKPKLRLFVRQDITKSFINCMVFLPKERFSGENTEKIQHILTQYFKGIATTSQTLVSDLPLAYLYVAINFSDINVKKVDLKEIEERITNEIRSWRDNFYLELTEGLDEEQAEELFKAYRLAFPASYQNAYSANIAANEDVNFIEAALNSNDIVISISEAENEGKDIKLKIYSPKFKIHLSSITPILENVGINIIDEHTYLITPMGRPSDVWLHSFHISTICNISYPFLSIKENVIEALYSIWQGKIQNDHFNKLITCAGLTSKEVVFIRAVSKYIHQTGFAYNQDYIAEVLTKQSNITRLIIEKFNLNFDPKLQSKKTAKLKEVAALLNKELAEITSSAEDKVIRKFIEVIKAILRTNYFLQDANGEYKEYISFKFNSAKVPDLPLPRPYAEIFVCSPKFEAIHLRGGKVARGGLRWSDRVEDFRLEVLGLMKAQMAKNSVIVPVGSKGGFVVKQSMETLGRENYLKEGIECYKNFLRGLLDITDNIVDGKIKTPKNIVRLDDDDPYLVVAADKGTATFSDFANQISKEYNFWLSDAFASGGSAGYDHKKMAITARGAWISVERHFREMGIDIRLQEFTVVGIGDMAGDVFGNGMLLSNNIRLVAAFNHMHIFIDPNPDSKKSYEERKRLFNLPRSTWMDYNKKLLSPGAEIYERKAKSLKLTKEIKELLEISQDEITPDELIKAILMAKVDLLWNGGIGTYVKSEDENNIQVGDKANDALRVNGKELRCSVVGEGGNLGFTQRGRIEYALNGGRINTDAIDNSAGVDCSDHEVNIKIALRQVVESDKLNEKSRNALLEKMTNEVAGLVLRDNFLQTQILSLLEQQGHSALEMHARIINKLEKIGLLDRKVEFLPTEAEITKRGLNKQGLTRPELAVLLAYSKIAIYDDLLKSNLPDDSYLESTLLSYFPEVMQEKFPEGIKSHPLRREIITTCITNEMVNRLGNYFFHLTQEDTGLKGCDIMRAYIITRDLFDLNSLWDKVENISDKITLEAQVLIYNQIYKLAQRSIMWLLRNMPHPLDVSGIIARFKEGVNTLSEQLQYILFGNLKSDFKEKVSNLKALSITPSVATKVAGIKPLLSAWDIVLVATEAKLDVAGVANLYFDLSSKFSYDWLRYAIDNLVLTSYWDRLAAQALKDDLYDQQRKLTAKIIRTCGKSANPVSEWLQKHTKQVERVYHFIEEIKLKKDIDLSTIVIASKRLETLL